MPQKKAAAARDKPMAVRLPPGLRQRLRIHAVKTDGKLQDVVAEAIDEYLKKRGA